MSHNDGMTLPESVQKFFEYLEIERGSSRLTIRNYRHYMARFMDFLQVNYPKVLSPTEITNDIIRSYRLYLSRFTDESEMPLKKVTQNYHLIAIRAYLKFLLKTDLPVLSPEKIDLGKAESRSLKFLDRSQVERLMNMPSISDVAGLRDKAIMELLFSTGLRVSELVRLNRDSVNFETKEFGVIGKGGRVRVVFMSDASIEWLTRYLSEREDAFKPLFTRVGGAKPDPTTPDEKMRLTTRSVQRIVEKYVKKARLPIKITPHGIRHSFATDLLRSGADIRSIQEMLGHKNISTTQIYTHVTNPQLKEIHEKFHRR